MKTTKSFLISLSMIFLVLLSGCNDDKNDGRIYQDAQVVAVKINEVLYAIDNVKNTVDMDNHVATFVLPAGMDLSNIKVEVLSTNGAVESFDNKTLMDARLPLSLTIKDNYGKSFNWTLRIQSPPKLLSFSIEGVDVDMKSVFAGDATLVIQVPKGTDLKALKVSMAFVNGTIRNFVNGAPLDYTNPRSLEVLGVDGTTVYKYLYIITTDPVGPATVKSMTINGIKADSVSIDAHNIVSAYMGSGILDFSNVNVTIEAGYGQTIDPSFDGHGLNLISKSPTVKITGSDGVQVTFTIGAPQISIPPLCTVLQANIPGTSNTAIRGAAFSGMNIVLSAQNSGVGCGYVYDFTGARQTSIPLPTSPAPLWGLHKVASDDNGVLLFSDLGLSAATQTVFKCDNVTGTMSPYIQFTGASIGSSTPSFRNGGIKIQGKLSGNALITLTGANTNEVFIWTVIGGVLNQTPVKYSSPYSYSNYWSVTPTGSDMATTKYVTTGLGSVFGGLLYALNPGGGTSLASTFEISNSNLTECAVTTFNGRMYMAYTYLVGNGVGVQLRLYDITDGSATAFNNPIMNIRWNDTNASIGNATMATDLKVINGKLYVLYMQTSVGFKVFCLTP